MGLLRLIPVLALTSVLAACSSGSPEPEAVAADANAPAAEATVRPDRTPLIYGPKSPDGLQVILGTADLGVGKNRFGFVLTSPKGFVTQPVAKVTSRYFAIKDSEGKRKETLEAEYQPWPYGNRGLYTARFDFGEAGSWGVDIEVKGADGATQTAQILFDVADSPSAPAVGAAAIRSKSKTVAGVESLSELTTGSLRDEDLYQTDIASAIGSGKPAVIVFASPAFCTNAVCGPQVEVLQQLKNIYGTRASFIHVDFYDNPVEIQGDLGKARLSPTVIEWRLPSIEWTFVIDGNGTIVARFEAFATYDEVDRELLPLL